MQRWNTMKKKFEGFREKFAASDGPKEITI